MSGAVGDILGDEYIDLIGREITPLSQEEMRSRWINVCENSLNFLADNAVIERDGIKVWATEDRIHYSYRIKIIRLAHCANLVGFRFGKKERLPRKLKKRLQKIIKL